MKKLALLLGEGDLAHAALQAAQQKFGVDAVVAFALVPLAWPNFPSFDLDDLPDAIRQVKLSHVSHICVAGRVALGPRRRMGMAKAMGLGAAANHTTDLGLEGVFVAVASAIGALPIGIQQFAAELLATEGLLFGPARTLARAETAHLLAVARQFGATDLGQSLVFDGRQPIAGEDIAGTDALLKRVAALPALGADITRCLVKIKKPQQSGIGDLPTIGPNTIKNAAKANISLILVEADQTLVLGQETMRSLCQQHQISVYGVL